MLEEDIDDTHLCIKCSTTIVGLESYVQHRKNNCSAKSTAPISRDVVQADHQFRSYDFPEGPSFHKPEEVEKSSKSLTDTYDLPYDLGADVFFSSLELQSSSRRTISNSAAVSSGGKHGSSRMLTRKATAALLSHHEQNDGWISPSHSADNLMKAVRDISGHKKCDSVFQLLPFHHDSPEPTDDDDDDDEDYEAVPSSHTGGKWKPDNPLPPSILRNSPGWDDRTQWDIPEPNDEKTSKTQESEEFDHDLIPPPSHTKGKWVPGTKIVKLDYKEDVEIEKIFSDQYWCNTCNRKLATKLLYDRHIKSNLHLKRSEPEQELERASRPVLLPKLSERLKKRSIYLDDTIYHVEKVTKTEVVKSPGKKVRKRRKYFVKCETCKIRLPKHVLGKHLISHYHYRRIARNPLKAFDLALNNIDKIVYQMPYQCHPCRFYTNTQDNFIDHWNSSDHADVVEGPGRFCCNLCKFECEDNNQMRRHLLGQDHSEVVSAINRSFPIIIGKRTILECPKCKQGFRYNIELRNHAKHCTFEPAGTASNYYQSKFVCNICNTGCKSRLSLQKHQLNKHKTPNYFCSACKIEFNTSDDAKKHRASSRHKIATASIKNIKNLVKKCKTCGTILKDLLELKEHMIQLHPNEKFSCPHCGKAFVLAQEVGRHIRDKVCIPSTSKPIEEISPPTSSSTTPAEVANPPEGEECVEESPKIDQFRCTKCEYRTSMKAELLYHEILHTVSNIDKDTKISCTICHKVFRKHSLRCHLRQHTNERLFECDQCPMKYARKHNLKTHFDKVHAEAEMDEETRQKNKEQNFQCDTCGKLFNAKFSLKQHSIMHNERDKKFKCPVEGCIFIGRNSTDLKNHLSVHTNERRFPCDYEGCNYKGKSSLLVNRHKRMHAPLDKKYECFQCDFKARIPGHLKRHIRIHTGEKPFKCPYCDFQCNTSENLRKHVLTTSLHAGRSLYECKFCQTGKTFKTNFQKEYRTHLVVLHRVESQQLRIDQLRFKSYSKD